MQPTKRNEVTTKTEMISITKSVRINAPVEKVFEFLTNPNHLPEVWPSLVEVSKVTRQPGGAHSFDWVYKMAGMKFKGHSASTEVQKDKLAVVKNEGGIPSTFRWIYESKDNQTELTVEVKYQIPNTLLSKLAEPLIRRLNDRDADTLLHNLKERMEIST